MGEFNTIDDFLNHKGTETGGGKYMKSWKDDGKVEFWLHTKRLPIAVWQHAFPRLITKEDKDKGTFTKNWYALPAVCWEDEAVLKKQYHRDRETGDREVPPRVCPVDKFIEWVRYMVETDAMGWTTPLFEFGGSTDPNNDKVYYAAGVYNGFKGYGWDDLDEDQRRDWKAKGLRADNVWSQNMMAKLAYVFTIVDQNNIRDGVQITTETQDVGDKVKTVINDRIASLATQDNPNAGNPIVNPFCIQVTYDKGAKKFGDKYHARYIERHRLAPEVERLIRSEPPDLAHKLEPLDVRALRGVMEKHCLVKGVPWDDIFRDAEAADSERASRRERDEEQRDKRRGAVDDEPERKHDADAPRAGGRRRTMNASPPPPPPIDMGDPCEECGAPMAKSAVKCAKCGTEYEPDEAEETPPPAAAKAKGGNPKRGLPF